MQVISWANQKGGVGKTTCCVNTAGVMAEKGFRTLVIDLDPQCNASTTLIGDEVKRYKKEDTAYGIFADPQQPYAKIATPHERIENLFVVPSSLELTGLEMELPSRYHWGGILSHFLQKSKPQLDFVFIDCPPNLGIFTMNAFSASNWLIVPVQTERYAFGGYDTLMSKMHLIQSHCPNLDLLGGVATMYDGRTKNAKEWMANVESLFGDKLLGTIHRSRDIAEATTADMLIQEVNVKDRCYREFLELAREICRRIGVAFPK